MGFTKEEMNKFKKREGLYSCVCGWDGSEDAIEKGRCPRCKKVLIK